MTMLLIAVMTVLFSLQSLFCKLFSERNSGSSAAMTSTVFSIAYGAFAGVVTWALAGFRFSASPWTLGFGAANAVMLLLYNTAMIRASRGGSYSFQMICSLFGGVLVPLLHEVLFLGGALSARQLAAIGAMLAAFVLMNLKGLSLRGSSGRFLLWCGALFFSNGMYGILMNWQQRLLQGAERSEMIILTFFGMALIYAVWQGIRDGGALLRGFRLKPGPLICLALCCVCATAAAHLMLYLLTEVSASVLYTIDNGGVLVLSVLYSCILFKEKLTLTQKAGIVLSVAAIVALSV